MGTSDCGTHTRKKPDLHKRNYDNGRDNGTLQNTSTKNTMGWRTLMQTKERMGKKEKVGTQKKVELGGHQVDLRVLGWACQDTGQPVCRGAV